MTNRTITAPFFKQTFSAEAAVCDDCGQTLWTPTTQQRFHDWVDGLKAKKREMFQVQFYLPVVVAPALAEILHRFPTLPKSSLIRALTTVFVTTHARRFNFRGLARELIEFKSYRDLVSGPRKKTSLQFSPMALLDLQSWAGTLNLAPNKIVEDAVIKSLALSREVDPTMRMFWENEMRPQLEMILRSL